jgi:cyclic beta-1,2-glucan synthetase
MIERSALERFTSAYQEVAPLTIAELWALPALLRAAVLRALLSHLAGHREGSSPDRIDPAPIERCVRSLRELDVLDWRTFFESMSCVETTLRRDPADVYGRMDFATCDSYRKVIEAIAWKTSCPEEEVAELAISFARDHMEDERRGHVGYYLLAEGRGLLEARLGYRPDGAERLRRFMTSRPTTFYLSTLALITFSCLVGVGVLVRDRPVVLMVATLLLAIVPVSGVATTIVHAVVTRLLPPRVLPKLRFKSGVPPEARTLVVIPTLLARPEDAAAMVRRLELHYLSNPDPELQFALLTDDKDSAIQPSGGWKRSAPLEAAIAGVTALNSKHGTEARQPFHLLHREPRWNPAEERFMGWERKRGKLEELNRLLRGDTATSYAVHVGDPSGLQGIRYVITLDSDTELPMGSARRLIGLLAHPLNRPVFDEEAGRIVAGYSIVQPRLETSPTSARLTAFARVFAGDIGFDIYTHACSELYQDLFGAGIYVGKGIYDVDAFARSVDGRVPENALVSHDLFEGSHGRTALATDIVLFESYPPNYATFALRLHRWIRGDWQLLPWLFGSVPLAGGERAPNRLAAIDRWKIVDNLRRSLTGPTLMALLLLQWAVPGSNVLGWTVLALVLLGAPLLPAIAGGRRSALNALARWGFAVALLPYEAYVSVDAIARALARLYVTRRKLLEWTTAADAVTWVGRRPARSLYWRLLAPAPALATLAALLIVLLNPGSLLLAAPLLVSWFLAPETARWMGKLPTPRSERVTAEEKKALRLLARRTWGFFEAFVGPIDQWLPIDNYQDSPHEQTAHRTSPTNIGLLLVASVSAYDFGYVGPRELVLRLQRAFDSISRLQHYQGHLLNWYDTKTLQPLTPKYVSTVDSGNFAGCLLAVKHACAEVSMALVLRTEEWEGLSDAILLLDAVVRDAPPLAGGRLRSVLRRMNGMALGASRKIDESATTILALTGELSAELDRELQSFLEAGETRHEPALLRALRTSIDRFRRQLDHMKRELYDLVPWLALRDVAVAHGLDVPVAVRLSDVPAVCERLLADLATNAARPQEAATPGDALAAGRGLEDALRTAAANATSLLTDLEVLAGKADTEARGMNFRLLYDATRRLFHIGYNATSDQLDAHYYDLLASEARLASYLAIVKGDAPESHWYALGRPLANLQGVPTLLSWGGTMFEYLMPTLLMRSQEGTLLARTTASAVDAQISYGNRQHQPWGISESAYARLDADQTYQYRSFGVPGLGFKRGLDEDHVVAPYASLLAVCTRPHAVVDNVAKLTSMGMLGVYGLFEALDLTPDRTTDTTRDGEPVAIVRSYMAHHQGMALVALGNLLNRRSMVDRFHADAWVQTGEALLNERTPERAPDEWPDSLGTKNAEPIAEVGLSAPPPWEPDGERPQVFVVGNGRLTSLLSSSGGGGLRWRSLALTRYEVDVTQNDATSLYLRDDDTNDIWSTEDSGGRTTCSLHKAEFHRRDHGISAHVDVTVASADDVEVRQITLHNETSRARHISVTSSARPVLFDAAAANAHPVFADMFVVSEHLATIDGILFARRSQKLDEETAILVHRIVHDEAGVRLAGFETNREAFFGRAGSRDAPMALSADETLGGHVGAVLDPIMSLMARVDLKPEGTVRFAFVTSIGRSRTEALELARKYGSMHAVRWAFVDAEQDAPRQLRRLGVDPHLLPTIFRLLSAVVFVDPQLRAPLDVRKEERASQQRLWGRGISGDAPIVLVRVDDPASELIHEVLAAQRYLRASGISMDLVLVDEHPSGYDAEGAGRLRRLLVQEHVDAWIGRKGGVFPIVADQAERGELLHLESASRVLLDTRHGSLRASLERGVPSPPRLPHFEPTLTTTPGERPHPRPTLLMDNGIGGFTKDGREYAILLEPGQVTPAPWINVLANRDFGCIVDESSFGPSWSLNSGENRLTPWRNDPVADTPSEAVYLRDEETAAVWSPTPNPAGRGGHTLIRHGAGYTIYERESHGIVQQLTVFVPVDASLKVARITLRNTLSRHRRLTATYYAEWVLGSRRELQRPYILSEFDRAHECLLARCDWNVEFAGRVAFVAAHGKLHGFTSDRTEFLGRHGDYARPEALTRWGLSSQVDASTDPCGVLQVHVELEPGEEKEVSFILGQSSSREEALALVSRFRGTGEIETAWKRLGAYWDRILGTIEVKTPEPAMDVMLNRWLVYQTLSGRVFGRTGFYQSSGAFGFRDQLQDVMALVHADSGTARAHIVEAARHQFEAGDVLHWWHPPSGRGVRTRCSDDLAWLPYVTAEYVSMTGDVGILSEEIPFLRAEELKPGEHDRYGLYDDAEKPASLFEHCKRALERATTEGAHGLPLMGDGDWNDGMNRIGALGRGESVWLAWFLCVTMDRFATLADTRGESTLAAKWRNRSDTLRSTTREVAWDGAWYLRAFHDDGSRVGSSTSRECRIDSIAQSWAVFAARGPVGVDDPARQAVRAADDALIREADRLVLLFWPPFDSPLHDPGYVRAYPPGVRENGGQYTHAAAWLGLAHAALGDGDGAEHVFRLLNPALRSLTREEAARYRAEPYALAGDIYSCPPWVGRGGWSWYTGSAAWLWRLGVEAILGLRLEAGRLRIDPCLPTHWDGFEAWVERENQRIHVVVERSRDDAAPWLAMNVDGASVEGNVVHLSPAAERATHEVVVRLGKGGGQAAVVAEPGRGALLAPTTHSRQGEALR